MKTNAYLGLVLTLGLAACGDSGSGTEEGESTGGGGAGVPVGATVDITGDGLADGTALDANNDGIPESIDRNGDGKADGLLPSGAMVVAGAGGGSGGTATGGTGAAGTTGPGATDIGGIDEDGGQETGGSSTPVVTVSKSDIVCGDSEVELDVSAGYVCCDTLAGDSWSAPTVKSKAMCDDFGGPSMESVGSSCDGKDDCGTGFCCFTYNAMGGPPQMFVPRAHGRRCLSEASCNAANGPEGQSGVFSCNDVSDCPSVFTTCGAEPSGGVTTAEKKGRSWVKVCQ